MHVSLELNLIPPKMANKLDQKDQIYDFHLFLIYSQPFKLDPVVSQ